MALLTDEIRRGEHGPGPLADLFASCDNPLHETFVELMSTQTPVTSRLLAARTRTARSEVLYALQHMIRVGRVSVMGGGYVNTF